MDYENFSGFNINGSPSGTITLVTDENIECPFCHISIQTQPLSYIRFSDDNLQVFLKCKSCKNSFIGYTIKDGTSHFHIRRVSKGTHSTTKFEKDIEELSPLFIQIYGEAEFAEQENLMQICGVGYRKALEFLIKDYLIKAKSKDEESIKKKLLGQCIKEDVDSTKIKAIAEKATWLGNDETHYVRKWGDKDLKDLKTLIAITVHFVSMDIQANRYIEEMNRE